MSPARLIRLLLLLLLPLALPAWAQDDAGAHALQGASTAGFDQLVYKGLVGNVLDVIPMNAADRVTLQRTNAVVSNTLFGRTLAVLAGLSNPVMLVGGLVWGIWSASNIRTDAAGITLAVNPDPERSGGVIVVGNAALATVPRLSAASDAPVDKVPAQVLASLLPSGGLEPAAATPRVIKVWLPQRHPVQLQ